MDRGTKVGGEVREKAAGFMGAIGKLHLLVRKEFASGLVPSEEGVCEWVWL